MTSVRADELNIDWKNLEQVKRLAHKFGPGMSVIKYAGRANYNITHTCVEKNNKDKFTVIMRT